MCYLVELCYLYFVYKMKYESWEWRCHQLDSILLYMFNKKKFPFRIWGQSGENARYFLNYVKIVTNSSFENLKSFEKYGTDTKLNSISMLDIVREVRLFIYIYNIYCPLLSDQNMYPVYMICSRFILKLFHISQYLILN